MHIPSNALSRNTGRTSPDHAIAVIAACIAVLSPAHADSPRPEGIAGQLIDHYHMQRIPQEGAWFGLTYTSDDQIDGAALPSRYAGRAHVAGNAIVTVATRSDFSALHRLQTDEVWHFYGGSPLEMLLLYPDGHGRKVTLGPDFLAGEFQQFTVPHGVWQGSAPRGSAAGAYSFAGTQLSPGFDYADFEIGYRDQLKSEYPAFADDIDRLTRAEFATGSAHRSKQSAMAAPKAIAFPAERVPTVAMSSGLGLQELVGRVARDAQSSRLSVARFTLAAGRTSATSFNHQSQEVFLVGTGTGQVHLDEKVTQVGPGSVVFIPAGQRHSIEADANGALIFFAISAPAFAPEDYVTVKP
jgi:predicted cupin superfamily sugar epimerase/mannose-6-phosphate isomerase-like protein (cupin superfamily)